MTEAAAGRNRGIPLFLPRGPTRGGRKTKSFADAAAATNAAAKLIAEKVAKGYVER
ncbi:MAG TPA: WGR domain-containing protein [Polyangia bacterium]|nr:WGR domain-containing protein [Polyangia bacterium]